jgi:hypothetical protein
MDTTLSEKITDFENIPLDPTRRYRVWEPFMTKYHCDVIAEIGVRQGFNFNFMVAHNPKEAVAVDCWIDDGVLGRNDSCHNQQGLDIQYNKFKDSVADKPFVKIHRGYSFDVVKDFPDDYFDLIFIDADHTYPGISRDLVDWWPKVKKGGVFCGHDYTHRSVRARNGHKITFGVVEAVDEFVKKNNLNLFVSKPHDRNVVWGVIK